MFSLWLPELFGTEARATAFAFCTSMGRFIRAGVNFGLAAAVASMGTPGTSVTLTAAALALGLLAIPFAPETRGAPLHARGPEVDGRYSVGVTDLTPGHSPGPSDIVALDNLGQGSKAGLPETLMAGLRFRRFGAEFFCGTRQYRVQTSSKHWDRPFQGAAFAHPTFA
jgi:hypothetical protein